MDKFALLVVIRLLVNATAGIGALYVAYLLWQENRHVPIIRYLIYLLIGTAVYNCGAGLLFAYQRIADLSFSLGVSAGYVLFNAFEAVSVGLFVRYMLTLPKGDD